MGGPLQPLVRLALATAASPERDHLAFLPTDHDRTG